MRPPSLLSVCVFTCTLLIAGLVAVGVGGLGRGTSVDTELTSALEHHGPTHGSTPGAADPTTGSVAAKSTTAAAHGSLEPATGSAHQPAATSAAAKKSTGTMPGMPEMAMSKPPVTKPILASRSLAGTRPSQKNPPNRQYHEFQVNCTITDHRPDDPIVFPGLPGASHNHTFFGNTTTNARSTAVSLAKGGSSCKAKADRSAYWMPSLTNGKKVIDPTETITYYKSDVKDYTSVRPFPKGLRFVAGSPTSTKAQFTKGYWSCGNSGRVYDIPATCPSGSQLIARYVAPSCWDGVHLDVPNHKSHMAYPVNGRCTVSHPVALPMLEFKIPYPVSGNMAKVKLSTGEGFTFHYDFFNAWDDATQAALVKTCINGGLQCDARGYDQHHPEVPPTLTEKFTLKS